MALSSVSLKSQGPRTSICFGLFKTNLIFDFLSHSCQYLLKGWIDSYVFIIVYFSGTTYNILFSIKTQQFNSLPDKYGPSDVEVDNVDAVDTFFVAVVVADAIDVAIAVSKTYIN